MSKRIFGIISLISLLITACGLTARPFVTPTPAATSTPTPFPTLTPLPSPTSTPTPIPEVRIDQADLHLFLGDYERALEEYQLSFLQADSDEVRAASLVGMGYVQYLLGNFQDSIDALITVIDVYPDGFHIPKTYFYLAQSYESLDSYEEAIIYYDKLIEVMPGTLDDIFYEMKGDAARNAGDLSLAVESFQVAILAANPNDSIDLEVKLARNFDALGDLENAVRLYMEIYEKSNNDYIKAQMNWLAGQAYLQMDFNEQAYIRFQDSMEKFPLAYDTYSAMEALLLAGEPIDQFESALVYYFAGKYGLAIDGLKAYIKEDPEHDGAAHHYLAFSLLVLDDVEGALEEWQLLIDEHPGNVYWEEAWDESAYSLWAYLDRYDQAAEKYLDFVNRVPEAAESPMYLYWAARLYELNNKLELAAETWERMVIEYPANPLSFRGLFLAGTCYYRLGDLEKAKATYQSVVVLASDDETLSGAHLWLGKIHEKNGDDQAAREAWRQAAELDPTGYYSERARELLNGESPLQVSSEQYTLDVNLEKEKEIAEAWLRSVFAIPTETDLSSISSLIENIHVRRGDAMWELGLYREAGTEYDLARLEVAEDPVNNFRLLGHLLEKGYYRHSILISRKILDLAHFDDASTMLAPAYFNHIRFGTYFSELILPAAEKLGIDPLILFSLVRQESFFEWYAGSSAGAQGLMQIIPTTGQEVSNILGWPENYSDSDLLLPYVNVTLGSTYLKRQMDFFGKNNLYAAMAAYNAGPSNADNWYRIAGDDPDLFLEVVRFAETRNYILFISEAMHIYKNIYSVNPE